MIGGIHRYGRKLLDTGFFHIVGAGSINKVLTFAMSVVLVRVLSKEDYGCYAYAFNIVSFFVMFNGLGMTSAIVQACSELFEDKVRSDALYDYCRRWGLVSDVGIAAGIVVVALVVPLAVEGSNGILLLYCAYPLLQLFCELRLSYMRVRLQNKAYARMTNVQTILTVAFSTFGAVVFGVVGIAVGQSLACAAAWMVMALSVRESLAGRALDVPRRRRVDVWRLALVSALNNGLGHALTLVGTLLVGILLVDASAVAEFKVATTVPFALLFMPGMVVTYVYPYFARHRFDRAWTLRNYARLMAGSATSMGLLAVVLGVLAEPILSLVFGEQYVSASGSFRMLLVGFFATASFRQLTGNLLVTQRKLGYNTLVGVVSIGFNVAVSFAAIPAFGLMGAAVAYTSTMAIGAFMNVGYYVHVVRRLPA